MLHPSEEVSAFLRSRAIEPQDPHMADGLDDQATWRKAATTDGSASASSTCGVDVDAADAEVGDYGATRSGSAFYLDDVPC